MLAEIAEEQCIQRIDPTLADIKDERLRQIQKWSAQEHSPEKWLAILGEEFGEVAKEIAEGLKDEGKYLHELTQVAAVAAAAIQCYIDGAA